ncbi:DUF2059 domain-containing protein [Pedobacter sp. PAMC26386]|nr:DUF2059 domain-containing protein [Pedobacter sp. PAMC26386]
MKTIILLFSFILCTVTLSFSQKKQTYQESLKQMMIATGAENIFRTAINQMLASYKTQRPEIKEEIWTGLDESFQKIGMDELIILLLPIYQKHVSEEDIQNITAFYQTPTGKRYAEKSPVIAQESMQAGETWGQKIGEELEKKLAEKAN